MKSSDMSQSFTATRVKRQQSFNQGASQIENKRGGRLLSLNAEQLDNSLVDMDIEESEQDERKNRLIRIAKLRQLKQTEQNNLKKAAEAA